MNLYWGTTEVRAREIIHGLLCYWFAAALFFSSRSGALKVGSITYSARMHVVEQQTVVLVTGLKSPEQFVELFCIKISPHFC